MAAFNLLTNSQYECSDDAYGRCLGDARVDASVERSNTVNEQTRLGRPEPHDFVILRECTCRRLVVSSIVTDVVPTSLRHVT